MVGLLDQFNSSTGYDRWVASVGAELFAVVVADEVVEASTFAASLLHVELS